MPSPTSEKKVVVLYGKFRTAAEKAKLKADYKVTMLAEAVKISGYKLFKDADGNAIAVVSETAGDFIVADVVRFGPKGFTFLEADESLEETLFVDRTISVNGEEMRVVFPTGVVSETFGAAIASGDYLDVADDDTSDDDCDDGEPGDAGYEDEDDGQAVEDVDTEEIEGVVDTVLDKMAEEGGSNLNTLSTVLDGDVLAGILKAITENVTAALEENFIIKKSVD
jgi:hypothetical protein